MDSSPEWSLRSKRTIALIGFAGALLLLYAVRGILPLVIVSALIAFICNPLVTFLTRRVLIAGDGHGARRGLAVFATFIIAFVFIVFAGVILIPAVADQLQDFGRSVPRLLQRFENDLERILAIPVMVNGEPIMLDGEPLIFLDRIEEATGTRDVSSLLLLDQLDINAATQTFFNSATLLTGPAFSFLGSAFNTLITLTFLLMMTYYLMKDGAVFIASAVNLVPPDHRSDAERLVNDLGDVWNAYIRGQLLLGLVIGLAVYVAATALGLPNAPILGLIAGVLEFIPNLGPFLALIPAAFIALVSESITFPFLSGVPFMMVVIITWTAIQQLEAVFLVPRIMGDSLDLHPFVVILGVLGGAAIGGALGVILAAPFVASGRVIARYFYGKVTNQSPFLERPENPNVVRPTLLTRLLLKLWRSLLDLPKHAQRISSDRRKRQTPE